MTPMEKVGQLFMTGMDGYDVNGDTVQLLQSLHVGGIYLTAGNMKHPKQVNRLSNRLQSYANKKSPLFIAIKQRGGSQNGLNKGLTPTFSQQDFGKVNNRLYTKQMAEIVGKELTGMGINVNLAPVLHPGTYSQEQELIAKQGRAAIEGYERQNILAAAGYFPDEPEGIIAELPVRKTELHAFDDVIKHGANAILTKDAPATAAFLRNKWDYAGLIIHDFSEKAYDVDAVITAIKNGADVILLNDTYKRHVQVIAEVAQAVRVGKISEDTIDRAVVRIREMKATYQMGQLTPFARDRFGARYSMFRSEIVKAAVEAD
jgi:beta-N-acetylhexosaminidase